MNEYLETLMSLLGLQPFPKPMGFAGTPDGVTIDATKHVPDTSGRKAYWGQNAAPGAGQFSSGLPRDNSAYAEMQGDVTTQGKDPWSQQQQDLNPWGGRAINTPYQYPAGYTQWNLGHLVKPDSDRW